MGKKKEGRREYLPEWARDYIAGTYDLEDDCKRRRLPLGHEFRDGSRQSYVFREQGRFGSYPIHDDYGDESSPY